MDCEEGRAGVAVIPGTEYIICVFADLSCELGMLKKKLVVLVEYLKEQMVGLATDQQTSFINWLISIRNIIIIKKMKCLKKYHNRTFVFITHVLH